jgi:hypothetical protein
VRSELRARAIGAWYAISRFDSAFLSTTDDPACSRAVDLDLGPVRRLSVGE